MYSTCMYFGLFPGNMCRGHGDSLLRQVLSPKTVVNVVLDHIHKTVVRPRYDSLEPANDSFENSRRQMWCNFTTSKKVS